MATDLAGWLAQKVQQDDSLSEEAQLWVLAALDGEAALDDLAGFTPPERAATTDDEVEPVGAFLREITVRGFRGIGPEATLTLTPFPSLTVISGRNGSGKSSFAEALEVALTGTSYRWDKRAAQWGSTWRNLHGGQPVRIQIALTEEGQGDTLLELGWPEGSEITAPEAWVQRPQARREPGIDSLGWRGPLETYRPLLTYEELGSLLTGRPSDLYDALSTLLGLGLLTDAVKALFDRRKQALLPKDEAARLKKALKASLEASTDERAIRGLTLIKPTTPDVAALRELASGVSGTDGQTARLHQLLDLTLPTEAECEQAAAELRSAVGELAGLAGEASDELQRHRALLQAAVSFHDHQGDQACPVCGTGKLDQARIDELRAQLAHDGEAADRLAAARSRHDAAPAAATALVRPVPQLDGLPEPVTEAAGQVREAWSAWAQAPRDPLELADHLVRQSAALREAWQPFAEQLAEHVRGADEEWSRLAGEVGGYAEALDHWLQGKAEADHLVAAHDWLKANEQSLKNDRIQPIADQAREIWASLRQESNVELAGLRLEGTNTSRKVLIEAAVDGQESGALAVMSQGELHALALALFLPRATAAASPFRFLVLDDPVQAMDPAKVDGLVSALLEIAQTRQVVVFSHDDRFASAVRRAGSEVPVTVLEVAREVGSAVSVRKNTSPAQRYLGDAFALLKDERLPEDTLRRVLPGLLRMALEAQAREVFYGRRLRAGADHARVEEEWNDQPRTRGRIELAMGLRDAEASRRWFGVRPYRGRAVAAANAVHNRLDTDPQTACEEVRATVQDIREGNR